MVLMVVKVVQVALAKPCQISYIRTMRRLFFHTTLTLSLLSSCAYGMIAGGRPNSISGGHNAFAGVVNPANAVWIKDRFDLGLFITHQKTFLYNQDNNPFFPPGKTDQTYKANYLVTADAAIHKVGKIKDHDCSISLATYVTPGQVKLRTKEPIRATGTTPILLENINRVISAIFSWKINDTNSIGFSLDYSFLSHQRNGFQNADNAVRSVAPGHVTNKGVDHSKGLGFGLGWRWNITKKLDFGFSFVKKSYVGQYKKYRGYEPKHGKNYIPQSIGGGFTYKFSTKLAGRAEVLWTGYGSLPNANNAVFADGALNTNRRGGNDSPGSGLQNATFLNLGLGYRVNTSLSFGAGLSHRFKRSRHSRYIIAHSYRRQINFNICSLGMNYNYHHNDFFVTFSHGFKNRQTGYIPERVGGGKFVSQKTFNAISLAWGYLY